MEEEEKAGAALARLLRQWRGRRRSSQRVLAEFAQMPSSMVSRAESGGDAKLSTWERLFDALGLRLVVSVEDAWGWDDCEDYLLHETDRRYWRKLEWLDRRWRRRR